MVKYHGTPISPYDVFNSYMKGKNVLVSYADKRDINRAIDICDKIFIDNGAFSVWKRGISINWNDYYDWVDTIMDKIEAFFIPDVIDGTEEENDILIKDYLSRYKDSKGIPIWHTNESYERLERLVVSFDYIAFGSSGEYSVLGTPEWHNRIDGAMNVCCDEYGNPKVKIHMLRCLNKNIFRLYPFYSGDSTTFAQNHKKYHNNYLQTETDGRLYLLNSLERYNSPKQYIRRKLQL